MKGFEYCYVVTLVDKISCACKSCRACTDDSYLVSVGCNGSYLYVAEVCSVPVCYESFKTSDSNGFASYFVYALALALGIALQKQAARLMRPGFSWASSRS